MSATSSSRSAHSWSSTDGATVAAGLTIAKIGREAYKTRDITGGLPRVAELFEARRPKDPATISEIDGVVRFGEIKRGKREVLVHPLTLDGQIDEAGTPQTYEVPAGKHLRVHEGDRVRAGDRLTEGPSTRTTSCGSRDRAPCRSTS